MNKPVEVSVIVGCQECPAQWEDYKTAKKKARIHSQVTGHRTYAECAYIIYWGKKKLEGGQAE